MLGVREIQQKRDWKKKKRKSGSFRVWEGFHTPLSRCRHSLAKTKDKPLGTKVSPSLQPAREQHLSSTLRETGFCQQSEWVWKWADSSWSFFMKAQSVSTLIMACETHSGEASGVSLDCRPTNCEIICAVLCCNVCGNWLRHPWPRSPLCSPLTERLQRGGRRGPCSDCLIPELLSRVVAGMIPHKHSPPCPYATTGKKEVT